MKNITAKQIIDALFEYIEIMGCGKAEKLGAEETEFMANVCQSDEGIMFDGFDGDAFIDRKRFTKFIKEKFRN
jgi:hypothetical protein